MSIVGKVERVGLVLITLGGLMGTVEARAQTPVASSSGTVGTEFTPTPTPSVDSKCGSTILNDMRQQLNCSLKIR